MTALRKFQFAQLRALRVPRRFASQTYPQGRALRPQPMPRPGFLRRAARQARLARGLRTGAEVLFGLLALAALALWAAVAVTLIR